VVLANGERIAADVVVSNADTAWTYRHLVAPRAPPPLDRPPHRARPLLDEPVRLVLRHQPRYEDVPHHTMLLGPALRRAAGDIFKRQVLAEDFSLYLHRPTATDPSMAPPGCDTFYVLSPVPHLGSGTDWAPRPSATARPSPRRWRHRAAGLAPHVIVTSRVTTPQDFQDRLLSYRAPPSGWSRCCCKAPGSARTTAAKTCDGLYMVGAGTHPGAGVPGVLMSAKALESVVAAGARRRAHR
jgi:phytoene desaturase